MGSISYLVAPKGGLTSGTVIQNLAHITFDYNDPIDTPLVQNTLDAGAPTSHVLPLPATTLDTDFTVPGPARTRPTARASPATTSMSRSTEKPISRGLTVDGDLHHLHRPPGPQLRLLHPRPRQRGPCRGHTGHCRHLHEDPGQHDGLRRTRSDGKRGRRRRHPGAAYTSQDDASKLNLSINWGDGHTELGSLVSVAGTFGGTIANTHRYADNGSYTVTLTLTDSAGTTVQSSLKVTVQNVAPTAMLNSGGAVNEGAAGTVSFVNPFDPSSTDTAAGFPYSYDFNNDGTFEVVNSLSSSAVVPAAFLADGPATRTIRARISDKDGGFNDYTTTINVQNVAPTVIAGAGVTIGPGATVTQVGSFTDPGSDTWTASVDYGDGQGRQPLALNPDKTFVLNHAYSQPGSFPIVVYVTDKDGAVGQGSFTVLVLGPPVVVPPVVVTSLGVGPVKLGTGKKAKKTTGIVIHFNGDLNPAQANSLAAFHLLSGKVKKGQTTYSKNVPLKSAIYNALAHTISLVPKGKLNLKQPEQLTDHRFLADRLPRSSHRRQPRRPARRRFRRELEGQVGHHRIDNRRKSGFRLSARHRSHRPSPRRS